MKKKLLISLGIVGIFLPFSVGATAITGSVNLGCNKTILSPNEQTTCTVSANTNEEVTAVTAKISLGSNLSLVSVGKSGSEWQGDADDGNIDYYLADPKSGNFGIATFVVKAGNITNGIDTTISLTDVQLSNDEPSSLASFTVSSQNIRIKSSDNTLSTLTLDGTNMLDVTEPQEMNKSSVNIVATVNDSHATLSGKTGAQNLSYGLNTFEIKVTSETGVEKVYTIKVNRPDNRDTNNDLLNFGFIDYNIEFNKDKTEYNLTVENNITKLWFCGGNVEEEGALCINNELFDIPEKASEKIYFNDFDMDYYDELPTDGLTIDQNIETGEFRVYFNDQLIQYSDPISYYFVAGDLKEGNNVLKITVTAENETAKDYIFNINRLNKDGKDVSKVEENPKTGLFIGIGAVGFIGLISLGLYFLVSKKKLFPKAN